MRIVSGSPGIFRAVAGALVVALLMLPLAAQAADDSHAVIHTAKGDFTFNIEVVDTPEGRARGLMERKSVAPDYGMLFDFHTEQSVEFWMKDTLVPLDMLFIDAHGVVKHIHANAVPEDETVIPSEGPVQFVLEIAGGRAAEIGLAPGDTMDESRVQPAK